MKFPIDGGSDDAPSNSAVAYDYINANFATNWNATENVRQIPISEDMTISDFKVTVETAPGAGKSRTWTVRKNGVDTAVTVTIADTATTATWSGSVSFTDGDLLGLATTPSGTPTAPGQTYWTMFWNTTGSKWLLLGGTSGTTPTGALNYTNPFGSSAYTTGAGAQDIVVPTGATLTKLTVAATDAAPGAGKSYACSMRLNNSSDVLTATISDTNQSASASGSQALSAGDTIQFKENPSGTPTALRLGWCFTVVPATDGESFYGYGSGTAVSTTATNYEQALGQGNNGWNATESTKYLRVPAGDVKKLFVRLSAAPGTLSDRTFTFRQNGGATTLTTTIAGTATTNNDVAHTVTLADNDLIAIQTVPNPTFAPAACNAHIGFVFVTTQPAPADGGRSNLMMMGV